MSYVTPKTNWNGNINEKFNISDYNRIKNNILYLNEITLETYGVSLDLYNMATVLVGEDHVFIELLNNIVYNINIIKENTFAPTNYVSVGIAQENGSIWNYKDLNNIETNILALYSSVKGLDNLKPKVNYAQMGLVGGL